MANTVYAEQQSYSVSPDDANVAWRGTRSGAGFTSSIIDQWRRAGKVFQTHNPTLGTAITFSAAAAGGHVLTAPSIRFSVPSSLVVVPLRLKVRFSAMAGTPNEMALVASETDTYSSGGTSVTLTAYNTVIDNATDLATSAVTNLRSGSGSALVEAALVDPRVIDIQYFARADAVSEPKAEWNFSAAAEDALYYVSGPASILVYISAVTTASAGEFVLEWAELDKSEIVNR